MTGRPLDPERWRRIEGILDRVFDAADSRRQEILDQACGDDDELRAEVEALLAAESAEGPLEASGVHGELVAEAVADAGGSRLVGRRLGPYRVDRVLGAGGMGVVYEAWDTRLERAVAIKLLPPVLGNPDAEERFLREARAVSTLDHPNICSIFDIGADSDGRPYLVMALYRGETLKERLEGEPLTFAQARDLARRIARGLARAHEAGIVHRDVKPANVFLTDDGEVKLLDFGLAKMADEAGLTASGHLLGTPAYMAPEQILGKEVDARADTWALGVLLYEVLTGRRPFAGESGVGAAMAAVHSEPPAIEELRPDTPADLADLVTRCLAKDPDRRPRDMAEVSIRLGDSTGSSPLFQRSPGVDPRPADRKTAPAIAAAVLVAILVIGGLWWSREPSSPASSSPGVPSSAPSPADAPSTKVELAVLYFHSLAGDPGIEGLGRVITEMLVTDLRGSPDLEVAGSYRLHAAMGALGLDPAKPPTPDAVVRLAAEMQKDVVLHGSFTRLGDRYRILATLENPTAGTVLMTRQVEASESGLFQAVDELSLAVRSALEASASGDAGGVRGVTTDSLEAMRLYTRGLLLYYDQRTEPAVEALVQAVGIDPDFALAWRRLGLMYDNLGRSTEAAAALERAFELADRLPPKQRVAVRADHYGSHWKTLDRSIEIYEEGLALYPDQTAWRNNLGYTLAQVERYEEAFEQYRASIELGTTFGYAYVNGALVLLASGRAEEGRALLEGFADEHPGSWAWQNALAWHLASSGLADAARDRLQRAEQLVAEPRRRLLYNRWRLHALAGEWPEARRAADALTTLGSPKARWWGDLALARQHLFHGRSEEALERLDAALLALPEHQFQAFVHTLRAGILLHRGETEASLRAAEAARELDPEGWFERRGTFWAALAEEHLGRKDAADARLGKLSRQARYRAEKRLARHLAGRLALARRQGPEALTELRAAADLLPPRGVTFDFVTPPHVSIHRDVARAARAVGRLDEAEDRLRRAVEPGSERLVRPLDGSLALYELGDLLAERGRADEARETLKLFLELREQGDLDRDAVEKARRLSAR